MAVEPTQILIDANLITAITNNINSLYGNLVSYTVGLMLLVGALLPLAISFFQQKQFKSEQDNIKRQISNDIEALKLKIEEDLKCSIQIMLKDELNIIQEQVSAIKAELDKEICIAKASAYHNQANINKDNSELRISSCAPALDFYLRGQDERNARSILGIIDSTIHKLNKKSFDDYADLKDELDSIIKYRESGFYCG